MSDSNDERPTPESRPSETRVDAGRSASDDSDADDSPLPESVIEKAERLTHLARGAENEREASAYERRRATALKPHDYTARVRTDDDVLVLHPREWHDEDDDVIRTDRIDDLSRAVEIRLEGAADPDDWDAVEKRNAELVERVRSGHGDVHGANVRALADFAGNHYAKPISELTGPELTEFRTEYFRRNAWPSAAQRAVIDDSVRFVFDVAERNVPDYQSG